MFDKCKKLKKSSKIKKIIGKKNNCIFI